MLCVVSPALSMRAYAMRQCWRVRHDMARGLFPEMLIEDIADLVAQAAEIGGGCVN